MIQPTTSSLWSKETVLTKAVTKAAEALDLSAKELALIIGISEASVSRMKTEEYLLNEGSKPFELSLLLVRLFRSLDAIIGGDADTMKSWMRATNTALEDKPINKIVTVIGLVDVISYLDARRAIV